MNSNLKRNLFGIVAIGACAFSFVSKANAGVAGTDYAITAATDATPAVCTAKTMEGLKDCLRKTGDFKDIKNVTIDSASFTSGLKITESLSSSDKQIDATGVAITIDEDKSVSLTGDSSLLAKSVTLSEGAKLTVNSKTNYAVKSTDAAGTVLEKGSTLTATADNKTINASSENTAKAVDGAVTVNAANLTVTEGAVGALTTTGKAIVKVQDVDSITAENVAKTADAEEIKNRSEITAAKVANDVTLADYAKLTKATRIDGDVEAANDSKVSGVDRIKGTATATDNATISAKTIDGNVTVNGEKATVEYASDTSNVTVTKGIAKKTAIDNDTNKEYTEVIVNGINSISSLKSTETLVIDDSSIANGFKVEKATNGAKIKNDTNDKINIVVEGKTVEIEAEKTYTVTNGTGTDVKPGDDTQKPGDDTQKPGDDTQKPGDDTQKPGDNTQKPGDDQPSKNPQTFDAILSYVGVALTSIGGLGVSLKKRLFR